MKRKTSGKTSPHQRSIAYRPTRHEENHKGKNLRGKPIRDKTSPKTKHHKQHHLKCAQEMRRKTPEGKTPRSTHKTEATRRLQRPCSERPRQDKLQQQRDSESPPTQQQTFANPAEQIIGGATAQLPLQDENMASVSTPLHVHEHQHNAENLQKTLRLQPPVPDRRC